MLPLCSIPPIVCIDNFGTWASTELRMVSKEYLVRMAMKSRYRSAAESTLCLHARRNRNKVMSPTTSG
jgi:hypothetical protein